MSARLIQVIEVNVLRGRGVEGDPCRRVLEYWSPDGDLLAERDQWQDEQQREARRKKPRR